MRQRKAHKDAVIEKLVKPTAAERISKWVGAHAVRLSVALVLLASLRIAATYSVFNHTSDEPAHLACGMEWLDRGTYKLEAQHPPLARVMAAVGPYLAGLRSHGSPHMMSEGLAILYRSGDYGRALALSRLGILPFFWVACAVVFLWARRSFGAVEAVGAVLLFSLLPPVLAHAGLSTTDMALTAFLGAAFLSGWWWLERPTIRRSALFGTLAALAVLSKLSSLLFLPVCALAALGWYGAAVRPGARRVAAAMYRRALPLSLAALIACLVIWGGYRFSFGKSETAAFRAPAPEFLNGIGQVSHHNDLGHRSYLLGEISNQGFLHYYPVVLAVKTPLPFLALAVCGVVLGFRKRREAAWFVPVAFIAAMMAAGLYSRINIGVRHILPIYLGMAVVASAAAVRLLERARAGAAARWVLAAAMTWMVVTSASSHPDYLAYTNALAGSEPERVLVDSDLDWGQDVKRLSRRLRELGAADVTVVPFTQIDLAQHELPPVRRGFSPLQPSPGYNAISITAWKVFRLGLNDQYPDAKLWPDVVKKKPERIGGSMLLWYFPPAPR